MGEKDTAYSWAFNDQADDDSVAVLGTVPGRWGRMTPLCRLLLVKIGLLLQEKHIMEKGQKCSDLGLKVGLIGGTRRGSLHTDQAFIRTMENGPGLASPALFGYTLPNIPLAEAASQFGLIGPVYALLEASKPLDSAISEAKRLLLSQKELSFMLACEFDHYEDVFKVNLTLVGK
jgi:3-oxoacyl-(acyl-carrier-protein) synthase